MIEGITILSTKPINSKFMLVFGMIVFGIAIFMYLVVAYKSFKDHYGITSSVSVISSILCAIAFFCLMNIYAEWEEKVEYIVTIDESVSFKEVMEHYDIIEKNGDLYTIRIKDTSKGEN